MTIECHSSEWIGRGSRSARTWTSPWSCIILRNAAGRKWVRRMIGIFIGDYNNRDNDFIILYFYYYMWIHCRAVTQSCRNIFSVETGYRMDDNQYINSFQLEIFLSILYNYYIFCIIINRIENFNQRIYLIHI